MYTCNCRSASLINSALTRLMYCACTFRRTVILGEHNALTEIDCEANTCADPVQFFKPKQIIFPVNYNEPPFKHDIALIQLNRKVKLSGMSEIGGYIRTNTNILHFKSNFSQFRLGNSSLLTLWWGIEGKNCQQNGRGCWMGIDKQWK